MKSHFIAKEKASNDSEQLLATSKLGSEKCHTSKSPLQTSQEQNSSYRVDLTEYQAAVSVVAEVVPGPVMMSQAEARQHIETIKLHFDDITALLLELDDLRGWEALGYRSMHQMIQTELKGHLNKSVSQIYRKVSEAKIRRQLSHACENIEVVPARQLEPLGKLPPEQWQDTWEEVTSTAPDGFVSREHVQTVVSRRLHGKCSGGFEACYTDSATTSNSNNNTPTEAQRSCWNCQHRGELIANHSFYCNRLGIMSLIDLNAERRGTECELWSYQQTNTTDTNKTQPTQSTFTLVLPVHLQPLIQDAACTTGMSIVDWAAWVLESQALTTCTDSPATARVPEEK